LWALPLLPVKMHDVSLICLGILIGWFLTVAALVVLAAPMRASQISRQEEATQTAKQATDAE